MRNSGDSDSHMGGGGDDFVREISEGGNFAQIPKLTLPCSGTALPKPPDFARENFATFLKDENFPRNYPAPCAVILQSPPIHCPLFTPPTRAYRCRHVALIILSQVCWRGKCVQGGLRAWRPV